MAQSVIVNRQAHVGVTLYNRQSFILFRDRLMFDLSAFQICYVGYFTFFKLQIDQLLMLFIDNQTDSEESQSESINDEYAGAFTIQPSKSALVADMGEIAFVQYVTLFLNWNSNSTTLQFTMDYSMDGVHWNDYVEEERVKVRRNTVSML